MSRAKWKKGQSAWDRILERAVRDEDTNCLLLKAHAGDNYPKIMEKGKKMYAHHLSYSLWVGELLPNSVVHHVCGNGKNGCVEPTHLQQTTAHENIVEMLERNAYLKRIKELSKAVAISEADCTVLRNSNAKLRARLDRRTK